MLARACLSLLACPLPSLPACGIFCKTREEIKPSYMYYYYYGSVQYLIVDSNTGTLLQTTGNNNNILIPGLEQYILYAICSFFIILFQRFLF